VAGRDTGRGRRNSAHRNAGRVRPPLGRHRKAASDYVVDERAQPAVVGVVVVVVVVII
jgi:hypothetical protein